jgi:carnitine 3-dehydrogenase
MAMKRLRQPTEAKPHGIDRCAVVGAGTIGTGWATLFASQGLEVVLFDEDAEAAHAALDAIDGQLRFLQEHDLLAVESAGVARTKLRIAPDLEDAVRNVQLVQEAVFESYEAKRRVFGALDRAVPAEVLLASSSSGLLMSEIQKAAEAHPERCLIAHPINPVYLIPLVELVPGKWTAPEVMARARAFYEGVGKVPVTLRKEVPGYLENRLTAAMWREAIDLVEQGVASVEDVDRAIWAGPGLRYALMGPLLIYHLAGGRGGVRRVIEHLGPAVSDWWKDMRTWTEIPSGTVDALEAGLEEAMDGRSIEEVTAWRDRALVDLVKRLRR